MLFPILIAVSLVTICADGLLQVQEDHCKVDLKYGKLQGHLRNTTLSNISFCTYKGIPYAEPPVGNLRFKEPVLDVKPWIGIKDATKEGNSCLQVDILFNGYENTSKSEDCLYLNVYTPQVVGVDQTKVKHQLWPVMVFMHGGGFFLGTKSEHIYGPQFLIEQEVILVTINYMLGILGFLNLGIHDAPGNVGLKDQIAALKWVKDNIHVFGGDPNRVTIFGESAGASAVHYHIISKISKGLFHRAIIQSGSANSPWAFKEKNYGDAITLAKSIGCEVKEGSEEAKSIHTCFMNAAPMDIIIKQFHITTPEDLAKGLFTPFLPSVENPGIGENIFFSENPMELFKNGDFNKVPVVIGTNDMEGFLFLIVYNIDTDEDVLKKNIADAFLTPHDLWFKDDPDKFKQVSDEIKKTYFNGSTISLAHTEEYAHVKGDVQVIIPAIKTAKHFRKHLIDKPIYSYQFAVDGGRNIFKRHNKLKNQKSKKIKGASHFDEINYIFNETAFENLHVEKNAPDYKVIRKITTFWTNFAKTGNPNSESVNGWTPTDKNGENCLRIGLESHEIIKSCSPRLEFWENLYKKYLPENKNHH